jgi:hypothetical protein
MIVGTAQVFYSTLRQRTWRGLVGDDVGITGAVPLGTTVEPKRGCELLLWQTDRGGDFLVSRIGCKWLEVGLDLHDDQ